MEDIPHISYLRTRIKRVLLSQVPPRMRRSLPNLDPLVDSIIEEFFKEFSGRIYLDTFSIDVSPDGEVRVTFQDVPFAIRSSCTSFGRPYVSVVARLPKEDASSLRKHIL